MKSKNLFLVSSLLFIFVFCNQGKLNGSDIKKAINKTKPAVVKIICEDINSVGSGFIVSPDGHIVTCHHVIGDYDIGINGLQNINYSKQIKIKFYDGQTQIADIITTFKVDQLNDTTFFLSNWLCVVHDFAVLKIQGSNLPFLTFSDTTSFGEGEKVFFCGYPFGSNIHTTHTGILSAVFTVFTSYAGRIEQEILQVDGSINKGNSGGPLLEIESGKVIGIISMREGRLTKKLEELKNRFKKGYIGADIVMGGLSIAETTKDLINVLDETISVGIGYAISSKYVQTYLKKSGVIKK